MPPGVERCCKRLAELAARRRQSKYNPFFAAACTSQKTLLSLQVWNLFAYGEQIMRAADCNFYQKSRAFFDIYIHMAKGRSRPPSTLCSRGRCSQSARVTCRDFSIMPSMSSSSVSMAGAPYSRVPHSKCSWKLR